MHQLKYELVYFTSATVKPWLAADSFMVTVCVCVQEATVVSCSQEKEGPTEKTPPSPVHSEREALLVGTLTRLCTPLALSISL